MCQLLEGDVKMWDDGDDASKSVQLESRMALLLNRAPMAVHADAMSITPASSKVKQWSNSVSVY
jgi:hypothetical protein